MQAGRDTALRFLLGASLPRPLPAYSAPVVTSTTRRPSPPASVQSSPITLREYSIQASILGIQRFRRTSPAGEYLNPDARDIEELAHSLYRPELCATWVATHLGAVQKMEDERSLRFSALHLEWTRLGSWAIGRWRRRRKSLLGGLGVHGHSYGRLTAEDVASLGGCT